MVYVQGSTCWLDRNKPITSSVVHFSSLIVVRSRKLMNADAGLFGRGGRGVFGCFLARLGHSIVGYLRSHESSNVPCSPLLLIAECTRKMQS